MPDILTVYAEAQPDKLAVIDDKGGDDVCPAGPTPSWRPPPTGSANVLLGLGARPGGEGHLVRPELGAGGLRSSTPPGRSARSRCR